MFPIDGDDDCAEFFYTLHSRTLPALNTSYLLPVDQDEVKRSDIHHRLIQFLFHGKNYVGPVREALQFGQQRRILDLGTGSGAWAIDIADEFPRAEVLAVDLAPIQPRHVPPNCTFELCDLAQWPLPFPDAHFDFVHARSLNIGMQDYPRLLLEISRLLRPGGLVLLVEPTLFPCLPPSRPSTTAHTHISPASSSQSAPRKRPYASTKSSSASAPPSSASSSLASSSTASFSSQQSRTDASRAQGAKVKTGTANNHNSFQPVWPSAPPPSVPTSAPTSAPTSVPTSVPTSIPPSVPPAPALPPPRHSSYTTTTSSSPWSSSAAAPRHPNANANMNMNAPMPGWAALWRTLRGCLAAQGVDVHVPEHLAQLLAGVPLAVGAHSAVARVQSPGVSVTGVPSLPGTLAAAAPRRGAFDNITVHDGTVPVGFWPTDAHLLSAGQLQWTDYELLLPALRPLFLVHGLAPTNVDRLVQDAQRDLYHPPAGAAPSTRVHVAYANKRYP